MWRREFLGLTLAGLAAPALAQRRTFDLQEWPAHQPVPPLQAMDMQGKVWSLPALKGRAVLVNFWATWCPPCRAEMPSLQQLGEIFDPSQLQILAINSGEGPRRVGSYMQATGLNLPVLLDPNSTISAAWGADALPTTVLIDHTGKARLRVRGEVDWTGRDAAAMLAAVLPPRGSHRS